MDTELLEQHRAGDERAFADIVRRHTPWVYALAVRGCRDAHLAEDVVQAVFILLHRKGPRFASDGAMIKWLHKAARYCSANAARSERRRSHQTAAAMQAPHVPSGQWEEIAPLLDQWIDRLPSGDRQAILLRYYLDLSFADVAGQIHCTPEAARKRVDRAVEKLRGMAERKGIVFPSAAFAAGLSQKIRIAPPAGLIARAAALPAPGSALALSSHAIVKGASIMMNMNKTLPWTIGGVAATLILSTAIFVAKGAAPAAMVKPVPAGAQTTQLYAKLSPFSAVRWRPQVQVNGTWYELVAIDDQPIGEILDFTAKIYRIGEINKRFDEDLVEVLTRKGYPPGDTVKLQLRTLDTRQLVTLKSVPMTRANRNAILAAQYSK